MSAFDDITLSSVLEGSAGHIAFTSSMTDWSVISSPLLRRGVLLNNIPIVNIDSYVFPNETLIQSLPRALFKRLESDARSHLRPAWVVLVGAEVSSEAPSTFAPIQGLTHSVLKHAVGVLAVVLAGDSKLNAVSMRTRQRVELMDKNGKVVRIIDGGDTEEENEPPRFARRGFASLPAHVWRKASARALANRALSYNNRVGKPPLNSGTGEVAWWLMRLAPLELCEREYLHIVASIPMALALLIRVLKRFKDSDDVVCNRCFCSPVVEIIRGRGGGGRGGYGYLLPPRNLHAMVTRRNAAITEAARVRVHPFFSKHPLTSHFSNPHGSAFRLILNDSRPSDQHILLSPPSTEFSWFPGYAWSSLECYNCFTFGLNHQVGWLFLWAGDDQSRAKDLPERFTAFIDAAVMIRDHDDEGEEEWDEEV